MPKFEYDKDYPFAAFVTNLGKYNEGELVGEWVKFPTTPEEMQAVFQRIGIGETDDFGYAYEEWFITDYDCYVDGLYDKLGEYSNIDELNYLASKLDDMTQDDYNRFCAAVSMGNHTGSIQDLINLTENLDCYDIYSDIGDDDDLGRYYLEEMDASQIPDYLRNYIDYEAYGRDIRFSDGGEYTDFGYVRDSGSRFLEFYNGDRDDIPKEYRVMNFETELSDKSSALASEIDHTFREYSFDYVGFFPKEDVQRMALADAIKEGRTPEIKTGLINLSCEMDIREEVAPLIEKLDSYEKDHGVGTYMIYQLKDSADLRDIRYEPLDYVHSIGRNVDPANYELVYASALTPGDTLESIYRDLNVNHPEDYHGYSLSMSDVVVLREYGKDTAHYCDRIGFTEVPQFLNPRQAQEKENPLRTAEMTIEDDYGMIDGVINNGRRDESVGKTSIRDRLEAAKKECSKQKSPEGKHPGRDVPEQGDL